MNSFRNLLTFIWIPISLPLFYRNRIVTKIYILLVLFFQTWFTGLVVSLQYSNRIFHSFPDKSLQNSYNSRSWFLVFNAEAQRSVNTSGFQSFSERCPKNSLTILCSVFAIFNASPLIAWLQLWRWKDSLLIYQIEP